MNPIPGAEVINDVNIALAGVYRRHGDFKHSIDIYIEIVKKEHRKIVRAAALQGIGQCYQEQGRFDDAVVNLERALAVLGKHAPHSLLSTYFQIVKEIVVQIFQYGILGKRIKQYTGKKELYAVLRADILSVLTKLYYFGQMEKLAWGSIANFNNCLHIAPLIDRSAVAIGDYAVSLVSAGLSSYGRSIFEKGALMSQTAQSGTASSIFSSRYAYYFLFYDHLDRSIDLLENATNHFRSTGEMWELMTATGALGQNYFLTGDFKHSEMAYSETQRVAEKLHSAMHIGWAYNKLPFMRYLTGAVTGAEAVQMLKKGVSMSEAANDHMTLCIHYGHLAYIAMHENDPAAALEYAERIDIENRLYKINVPHVKISLANAVEAVCYAFEQKAVPAANADKQLQFAEHCLRHLTKICKNFQLLQGAAYRADARLALLKGKRLQAAKSCGKALQVFESSPYVWEYITTLLFAGMCGLDADGAYKKKAAELMASHSLSRERH